MSSSVQTDSIRSVAVYCGSNFGITPVYQEIAGALGREIAEQGLTLVYGGTQTGLMGVVADAALKAGGTVVGVIYRRLYERGQLHPRLTRHEVTESKHERKARMVALADAFIALPGGLGTFEELFEAATLTQIGDHQKPCGVLNVGGFYEPMRSLLDKSVTEGFMKTEHRDMILIETSPRELLEKLNVWQAPTVSKWINQSKA